MLSIHNNTTNIQSHYILYNKIGPRNRQCMVRRLAAVKQRRCYIELFKLLVEHNATYTVNMNDVLFNMSPLSDELVQQIDEIIKRCEERKQQQVAICV
ncbi:MAG: hypothetical protein ACKPKO_50760 [Candidatus Fonsibacter sp.]